MVALDVVRHRFQAYESASYDNEPLHRNTHTSRKLRKTIHAKCKHDLATEGSRVGGGLARARSLAGLLYDVSYENVHVQYSFKFNRSTLEPNVSVLPACPLPPAPTS